jgi:starch phosphorylase
VLPEALEKWSVDLIGRLLPRHLDLIYLINFFFLEKVKKKYPSDAQRVSRMSLVEEGDQKKIRMAFLSIVCSHTVNGVAALHTELLKQTIFKDFDEMFPGKIQNKTNGVTPRRWIHNCNPELSNLISDTIGPTDEWLANLTSLRELSAYSTDDDFVRRFIDVKRIRKARL